MKRNSIQLWWSGGLALAVFFMVAGCATSTSQETSLEKNWGRAFETQRYLQIANPEAGKEEHPNIIIDGMASEAVMDEYYKSFGSKCEDETVNIIKLR